MCTPTSATVACSPRSYRSSLSRADVLSRAELVSCADAVLGADFLARFDQQQQRAVVGCWDAQPVPFAHDRPIDGVDLSRSAALHVLEHRRLGGADIATVLAHARGRVGVG